MELKNISVIVEQIVHMIFNEKVSLEDPDQTIDEIIGELIKQGFCEDENA